MRSSIACVRCRRSKVKCVNNGVGTTCRSCENSGRECSYPSPVASGSRRRDSLSGGRLDDAPKRLKKSLHAITNAAVGPRESPRPQLDALDPRLLTTQVWQELFDIFQIHYSADLPFLHPPTFLKPLRFAPLQPPPPPSFNLDSPSSARPPGSAEFLLSFLALTARFHPKIVAHHSPPTSARVSNPLVASEYYAMAAHERMANVWTDFQAHDLERTQAALMLGLHEWGMCRGSSAWLIVGMAIRSAQAMGLQYESDLDDAPLSQCVASKLKPEHLGSDSDTKPLSNGVDGREDDFIQQEVRRRTFWSCFVMDRYLSSGKYRPRMLHVEELRIQLPASERSFLFAEKVRTLMLGEEDKHLHGIGREYLQNRRQQAITLGTGSPADSRPGLVSNGPDRYDDEDDHGRLERGSDEGLVSRYIKVLELYGKVVRWCCAGGRRSDRLPPWDPESEFARLRQQCAHFKARLPRQHTLTPQNTQAHISLKASTPYMLVHTALLLCQVMLHREYLPFVPLRCSRPEGPLDPPFFSSDRNHVPAGFWQDSAREMGKAARDIVDLVRTCQEWNALVATPIVGFAVYQAALVGVYCINFPWMDPEGHMCTSVAAAADAKVIAERTGESKGFEAARKALEIIGNMRLTLHMADGWFGTINRTHRYFRRLKGEYRKNVTAMENGYEGKSPLSAQHFTLREGGLGGGSDEYKLLERTLNDLIKPDDDDVDMVDAERPAHPADGAYDDSDTGSAVKSEEPEHRTLPGAEPPRSEGGWSAINTAPSTTDPSRKPSASAASSGQFRTYEAYPPRAPASRPPPHQPSQPNYAHQLNNFRPAYPDGPNGGPPSLTSSGGPHAPTTSSQPSPPLPSIRDHLPGNWSPPTSAGYHSSMQPPQPPPPVYTNGHHHHSHHNTSLPPTLPPTPAPSTAYSPTPMNPPQPPPHQQQLQPAPPMPEVQRPWTAAEEDAWLNGLDTRFGSDDVAAFVEGHDLADRAAATTRVLPAHGWLTTIWNDA